MLRFSSNTEDLTENVRSSFGLINIQDVNASALLLKPTNSVAHGGGKLIDLDSVDYNKLKAYAGLAAETEMCAKFQTASQCEEKDEIQHRKLRRLTKGQIVNTVVAAFGEDIRGDILEIEDGSPTVGMASENDYLKINDQQLSSWNNSLEGLVSAAILNNADLQSCSVDFVHSCLFDVILNKYAVRILRRPLSDTDAVSLQTSLNKIRGLGGSSLDLIKLSLKSLLLNPLFFYRSEIGLEEDSASARELDAYEVASFLSYSLWNQPPDQILLNKAKDGSLKKSFEIKNQLSRLLADVKSKQIKKSFFADYLKIDIMKEVIKDTEVYPISIVERESLHNSVLKMVETNVSVPFAGVFSTSDYYVNTDNARFFNVTSDSQDLVSTAVTSTERVGILNHPAFLSIHANPENSGIVKRGVFVLEQLLCNHLGTPPDDISPASDLPDGFDEDVLTSREVLHIKHSSQPACISCHTSIDNIGGGLENFDGLGRFRTTEKENVVINAAGVVEGIGSLNISFSDSVDMTKKMTASDQFQSCLNKKFYEYVTGEVVSSKNACSFNQLKDSSDEASVKSFFERFTDLSFFAKRRREDP